MSKFKFLLDGEKITPYLAEILRQGERAVDTAMMEIPVDVLVGHGDVMEFIYDNADVDNLLLSLPMQNSSKDESGNGFDGVDSDVSYVKVDDGRGASIASGGNITVDHNDGLNFGTEDFVVAWRGRFDGSETGIFLKKGSGWSLERTSDGITVVAGDVDEDYDVELDEYVTVILRGVGNLLFVYLDGTLEGTYELDRSDVDTTDDMIIQAEHIVTDCRIYVGDHTDAFIAQLNKTVGRSFHTMWYAGEIWKLTSDSRRKIAQIQSFGKILGEVEVRGNVYTDTTIDAIVKDVIETHTDLEVVSPDRNLTIKRYVTDGYLLDTITELANLSSSTWAVDARKNFTFEEKEAISTDLEYEHGRNAHIFESEVDDIELVNGVTVVGEPQRVQIVEAHTVTGTGREITLGNVPIVVAVTANTSDAWIEGTDYEIDIALRKVKFLRDIQNVPLAIQYEYEKTLRVEVEDEESIAEHGRRHKRLFSAWVTNRTDALKYANTYLSVYSRLRRNLKATIFGFEYRMQENAVVRMVNGLKEIDGSFLVKSMKWKYPQFQTEALAGEYSFDDFEARKSILAKIHSLEQYLTRNKEAFRILASKVSMEFDNVLRGGKGMNSNTDIGLSFSLNAMETGTVATYGDAEYGEGAYSG